MKTLLFAIMSSLVMASSALAGGLVPGSEAGIESHEAAQRLAVAEGGHVSPDSSNHSILSHPPRTFGYIAPSNILSRHNIVPGSDFGVERAEETARDQVQFDRFEGQSPLATTPLGWNFLVPGSEYGLR